ncbi:MAG: hypothetical protein B7Y56_00080 [Gallionellales bacterium 35-53-114]|nr:MAG: hypothetical protein B7Y56_00080 [Gallionellales bacterium 35-53-114]OYZ62237.1 MAG: hypothetical protein B7Y04_14715 [Gallionellales bacterium 24-53-125]OZB10642.1 MAG: hypothetical protein B7X61_03830 [Gallionellales bacterium 39-52-133]HQS57277.1 hypothetical protein [Gallionellaceae bacterium]HQS74535.1 hypothetical protein [Gallionellaceae bacterium]
MKLSHTSLYFACVVLAACGTAPIEPSDKHIRQPGETSLHGNADIPQPSKRTVPLTPQNLPQKLKLTVLS